MRKINKIVLLVFYALFLFYHVSCTVSKKEEAIDNNVVKEKKPEKAIDIKEEMKLYLGKINPVLINVQDTSRRLSQRLLNLEMAIKQMGEDINTIDSLTPPENMVKQHKAILLSFKKLRLGFYLLGHGDRPMSVRLVTSGRDLLRLAVRDILEFCRKEGLINKKGEDK
ncbi:MAG: hypothetical protein KKC66_01835 [Candidatus Omnitrophica bacterium]|nr:hypothetical protein [Candidatus Omnitrophota bacterium]MBU1932625.1 hypothetical protein [Candidatus Omnitrophota bacterium]